MKTIIYVASTLNGLIARENDKTDWTSKEDWQGFKAKAKEVGNIIIGRNTFDIINKEHSFIDTKLRVVVTHETNLTPPNAQTIFTDKSPREVLKIVESHGFSVAMVAGGGQINSLFLKAGVVDELFVDIEPVVLGRGIPLFSLQDMEIRLKLLETVKLNESTIQLHYQVIK